MHPKSFCERREACTLHLISLCLVLTYSHIAQKFSKEGIRAQAYRSSWRFSLRSTKNYLALALSHAAPRGKIIWSLSLWIMAQNSPYAFKKFCLPQREMLTCKPAVKARPFVNQLRRTWKYHYDAHMTVYLIEKTFVEMNWLRYLLLATEIFCQFNQRNTFFKDDYYSDFILRLLFASSTGGAAFNDYVYWMDLHIRTKPDDLYGVLLHLLNTTLEVIRKFIVHYHLSNVYII